MFKERFKDRGANKRAISRLTVILIVIIVLGSVLAVIGGAIILGFWKPLGRIVGSERLASEKKDFSDFAIVEAGWGFEVEITQSDSYSINITADENMLDYIEVSQTGDLLIIGLKWGYSYQDVTLRAEIKMPELYELRFSGGTHGFVEEFVSIHEFVVDLSGGSRLSGDFTTSGDAQFTVSGGSRLLGLVGAANNLTANASGGSVLELSDFSVHDATVNLSGASSATINLDGGLGGDLSGGSSLKYLGNPTTVDVNTSGGSTVGPQ